MSRPPTCEICGQPDNQADQRTVLNTSEEGEPQYLTLHACDRCLGRAVRWMVADLTDKQQRRFFVALMQEHARILRQQRLAQEAADRLGREEQTM